VVREKE